MAAKAFRASPLPYPPMTYSPEYVKQLVRVLELYFSQLDAARNAGIPPVDINARVASYTLALSDLGKLVSLTLGSATTLTVPPYSSTAWPIGGYVEVTRLGAGDVTLTPGAGVTISSANGLKLSGQYGVAKLVKLSENGWLAYGDLVS